MHVRFFSAHLGRFLSFDPVGGNAPVPQSWNRYSYVLGNPVKHVDPYGLTNNCFPDGICSEPIPRVNVMLRLFVPVLATPLEMLGDSDE